MAAKAIRSLHNSRHQRFAVPVQYELVVRVGVTRRARRRQRLADMRAVTFLTRRTYLRRRATGQDLVFMGRMLRFCVTMTTRAVDWLYSSSMRYFGAIQSRVAIGASKLAVRRILQCALANIYRFTLAGGQALVAVTHHAFIVVLCGCDAWKQERDDDKRRYQAEAAPKSGVGM